MIVPDTSAWVGFLRRTGQPAAVALRGLLDRGAEIAVTEVVMLELLAGATPGSLDELRSRLLSYPMLPLEGLADFEHAAFLFRSCRRAGERIGSMMDCLIAVPAIKAGAEVLHDDRDFEAIARHSPLKVHRPR